MNIINKLILLGLLLIFFASCSKNNETALKQKEIELKERELRLRQNELDYEKDGQQKYLKDSVKLNARTTELRPDYSAHTNFNIFWKNFKDAVLARDKNAVLNMTNIPFIDNMQDNDVSNDPSLTSKTSEVFLSKYNILFSSTIIKTIKNAKFKKWPERVKGEDENDVLGDNGPGLYEDKGSYLLITPIVNRSLNLEFKKINGIFKLTDIPFYE